MMSQELNNAKSSSCDPLYVSKLLTERRINDVCPSCRVTLPGVDVESYAGYITVDKKNDGNLFFWFFPSTKVPPDQAPLLVYLNGGPGNSSMIGLFEELGPLKVDEHIKVGKRHITWTDQFSVIFIDSPWKLFKLDSPKHTYSVEVGVGFSYCKPGWKVKTNKVVAKHLYSFLIQFLQLFPEYQKCDLYLGGVSYSGKYVPAFAYKVHTSAPSRVNINLKGIYILSGFSDPGNMLAHYPELLVSLGLITEKVGQEVSEKYAKAKEKHAEGKYEEAVTDILELVFSDMGERLGYKEMDNALVTKSYNWKFEEFLNQPDIQSAIHVRPTHFVVTTDQTIMDMAEDFLGNVNDELACLMDNYKVLIYTGNCDMIVSVPMTEVLLKSLPWSGKDEYLLAEKKKLVYGDEEIVGYVTKVKQFARVVMRNAGHRPAIDQPAWTLDMISKFIYDKL